MFLQNCWYVAAWDHELIDGKLLARTILEKPVLIYKGESGRVVALDNRCCHRGAKLSNGRMEGDDIRCMYHGLKFDPSGQMHPDSRARTTSRPSSACAATRWSSASTWSGSGWATRRSPIRRRSSNSTISAIRPGAASRTTCITTRTFC